MVPRLIQNIQNLMVVFIHFCFRPETPFLVNEGKRIAIIFSMTLPETDFEIIEIGSCFQQAFFILLR